MNDQNEVRALVIVGPTAVGKTEIAIRLAQDFNGEIINVDSRQVYRGLDIGTAKPTQVEQAEAKHHLIDILDPDQWLNVNDFQELAYLTLKSIHAAGKLPILAGGTGQYMRAILEGWAIPCVEPDHALRLELEAFSDNYGPLQLHRRLSAADPAAGRGIDPYNVRRVTRALEVYLLSGMPLSERQNRTPPVFHPIIIGLTRSRDNLYQRVEFRVANMLKFNWINETITTMQTYPSTDLPSLNSLGYPEIAFYMRGMITYTEMVNKILNETHRFIRQQYNWFSLKDEAVHWFNLDNDSYDDISAYARDWLE